MICFKMHFNSIKLTNLNQGIKISLISSLNIIKWSSRWKNNNLFVGNISESYTVNFNTGRPELNGLFCERIFGPIISWKCDCNLFNPLSDVQVSYICPICNSESTNSFVRRYRLGYIYLEAPMFHTWYVKNRLLSLILNYTERELNSLVYYTISDYYLSNSIKNKCSLTQFIFSSHYIQFKLSRFNLINKILNLKSSLCDIKFSSKMNKSYIDIINLLNSLIINNIKPEWFLIDVLPVIPAGLRPLIKLDERSFAMSNINELYRAIIIRNNKIKKLKGLRRKSAFLLELLEKANLQRTIDSLFNYRDKGNKFSALTKKSYFKQYLLGKRVNFSGRSVITSGPTLPYLYLGIPFLLALKLFEFKLLKFIKQYNSIRIFLILSYYVEYSTIIIKRVLKYLLSKEVILINRAPTLHRMNIQAFKPYLVEGNAIKLPPLTCSGFNADFDGDQMGVFLLISDSATKEAKKMLISDKNLCHPAVLKNTFKYSQSIVLGLNTLLALRSKEKNYLVFKSVEDAFDSYSHGLLRLNDSFFLKLNEFDYVSSFKNKRYLITSLGRLLLQNII